MLLQLDFYSPLAKATLGDYEMPSLCVWVDGCACMCVSSHFKVKLYIVFIYEDIFTKFAENVYGCENMSVKKFVPI